MFLLIAAQLAAAQAIDFVEVDGPHLTPDTVTWGLGTTVGSPGVFVHKLFADATTTYGTTKPTGPAAINPRIMVYETQVAEADAGCPQGYWGIGWAFSDDGGVTWIDQGPLLEPEPGTYYSCVAAHPAPVALPRLDSWMIYFKAEQDEGACDPYVSTWGCERYSGVGRIFFRFSGLDGKTLTYSRLGVTSSPILSDVRQDMGYPGVMFHDGEYHMMFGQRPDLYYTSSPTTFGFPTPTEPAIAAGSSAEGWDESELLSPTFVCDGGEPFSVFTSGRVFMPYPNLVEQSLGAYTTSDFATYTEQSGAPYLSTSDGDPEQRHTYVVSSNQATEFRAYYTTATAKGGGNEIYSISTADFDPELDTKRCP